MLQADRQRRHPEDLLRRILSRPEEPGGGASSRNRSHRSRAGRTGRCGEDRGRAGREERRYGTGARRLRLAGSGGLGTNPVTEPPRGPQTQVLLVSEDDDIGEPLEAFLRRAGYAVEVADGREAAGLLRDGAGGTAARAFPDALIPGRDLPPHQNSTILHLPPPRPRPPSVPFLLLRGGALPQGAARLH